MNLSKTGSRSSKPLFIPLIGGLLLVIALLTILPANAREMQQEPSVPDGLTTVEWGDIQSQIMASVSISQQAKLTASDAAANDGFGYSVAVSGETAVIGASEDDGNGNYSGSAYIFIRTGSSWSQQAKLTADDAATDDYFGGSVAIDGDMVIIGASGNDDNGSGSGSAYIFTRTGGSWSQQTKLIANDATAGDDFGWSVAVDGDTVVIGADSDDGSDGSSSSGSGYVFTRIGDNWSQQTKLTADDATEYDHFGWSVAVDGDTAVIGAIRNYDGAVYVFIRSGGSWSQQTRLIADDAATGDVFGISVAVDGDTTVIGAIGDDGGDGNSGSAYIFTRVGSSWSQQAELIADDAATDDWFGISVAVYADTAVIGAGDNDDDGIDSGSAYIFTRSGSSWSQQAKLTANDATENDSFGRSVAVNGKTAVIGADNADDYAGSAYVFVLPPYANNDWYTVAEDTPLTVISATGVISNDIGTIPLSVTVGSDVSNGTLTLAPDGGFIYTPTFNFNGVDTFSYILTDGVLTDMATVSITVTSINDPFDNFIITVKTDNSGTSSDIQFTIPTTGSGYNYNVDCDSDGTDEATAQTADYTCNYSVAGTYTVTIKDNSGVGTGFPRIYFNYDGDRQKLLTIEQWGTGQWSSMVRAFYGCTNLAGQATDTPNLSNVTNMESMFGGATAFNQDIGSWDTAVVTDMGWMFNYATAFNQDIGGWDTAAVTDMNWMFGHTTAFNQDIGGWDTAAVTSMSGMFYSASVFNQDIGSWDTAAVTSMFGMFISATAFNQDIGGWDTATVTNMTGMFNNATAFNQNIGGWDTAVVTDMDWMFYSASVFNQDIGSWDTAAVTNMGDMFGGATSFNQDIGGWDVGALARATAMFDGVTLSARNYDALLIGWDGQMLNSGVIFSGGNSTYCAGEVARANMINSDNWTITDGGNGCLAAVDDTYTTLEDIPLVISSTSVISNDLNISGTATVTVDSGVSNGTLNLNLNGRFTYTPSLHFNGEDYFSYILHDGLVTDTAVVTITVTPINDAPIAVDDVYTATESITMTVRATGVLANDSDLDMGDGLTAVLNTNVTSGTLTLNPDGSFTYTSNADHCGTDSFTYYATDGAADSNIATVTINIICTHELTVILAGTGEGSVSSSPAGISCGGDCSEMYVEETAVTLTATASIGYFAGWSGAGCSGTGICVVTMDSVQEVTATFSLYTVFLPVIVR